MSKFLRASLAGISMTLIIGVLDVGEANAQGVLMEILARMDKHSKSLLSLKADLKLVKDDAVIDETDTYEGAVTLLPKTEQHVGYARIDWAKPRAENITLVGDSFEVYSPHLKTITRGTTAKSLAGSPGIFGLLSMSKRQIKENYNIDYFGQEQIGGGVETWHLRVTPKNRTFYKAMHIWVDGDGMPLQVMQTGHNYSPRPVKLERLGLTPGIMAMVRLMEEDTGVTINCDVEPIFEFVTDTTTLRLSNLRKNVVVEGSIFRIIIPKGTKVIKL